MQSRVELHSGGRQPGVPEYEIGHRELVRLGRRHSWVAPRPAHPPSDGRPRPPIHVLPVVQRTQRKLAAPRLPTGRVHRLVHVRLHHHRPRVLLPRPAEERPKLALLRRQVGGGGDLTIVDGGTGVLVRVSPALRRDGVLVAPVAGLPRVDVAVLEDGSGVAEDKVDGAVDVGVPVELAVGMGVEGVLVALDGATVDDGPVRADPQSHPLVLGRAGGVLEGDVPRHESFSSSSCMHGRRTINTYISN